MVAELQHPNVNLKTPQRTHVVKMALPTIQFFNQPRMDKADVGADNMLTRWAASCNKVKPELDGGM